MAWLSSNDFVKIWRDVWCGKNTNTKFKKIHKNGTLEGAINSLSDYGHKNVV